MRDDHRARRTTIIRKRKPALDVQLEAGEGGVVADGAHDQLFSSTAILAYVDVDVEMNVRHTGLFGPVRPALVPGPDTAACIADIGKPKALPGPASWKLALTDFAGKLPRQHGFLALLVGAEDKRAKFAMTTAIAADHLLPGEDGVAEEGVSGGGHLA